MYKQIKPLWSILCQDLSIDQNTNNVSLFNIVEEVKFELKMDEVDKLKNNPTFDLTKPMILPFKSNLIILWRNSVTNQTAKFPVKILLKDPKGKTIQEINNNYEFKDGKERLRSVIALNGIPLTEPGEYTYSIMTKRDDIEDFKEVGSIPVKINIELKRI